MYNILKEFKFVFPPHKIIRYINFIDTFALDYIGEFA
jgi:hypothetical protein